MIDRVNVSATYKDMLTQTGKSQPLAAAILTLAEVIDWKWNHDAFGHEICMGIRKGLFGARADDSTSIADAIGELASVLERPDEP